MSEFLYGRNPIWECLRAGRRRLRRLLLAQGVQRNPRVEEIVGLARQHACPIEQRAKNELSRLCRSGQHQGLVLETGDYPYRALEEIVAEAHVAGSAALILLLDRLQDPQNVGTLLRTAEAVGVQGVVLPQHRAASITPAVVKASAGATEHLSIAQETNLARTVEQLKGAGLWVLGLEEGEDAVLYTEVDWDRPLVLVVGSEGSGLRRLVRERCDGLVRLPMRGKIASLNASVAGSVMLYEVWRSRLSRPAC
ncbi:MAG: 23S rRNA (guanosine(2251)-2'-O)-methyltransferase RlmB [Chloroflexia bacterium]|nr:23S rRNA (guanosine(2251)-2'-O)-methyltransferase RlmB [Chloroflexia bacterium]